MTAPAPPDPAGSGVPHANAWLAAIVASSDDAIVSKNLDGIVTSWNPAAERIFGFTAAEMIGQPILRIIPPSLHYEEDHILARIRSGERVDHFETVRQRKDGKLIHVAVTISPMRDSTGRIVGASKIARNIDAQREGDRAQATLAAIIMGSDDAIISKTLEGIVTSWNPAAERLYGFTADEIVGQSILRIVPPSLHAEEDYILGKIRAGERIDHFETLRMRKDGSTVEVSITISPVRDSHGRLIGASKIARDISHQREEQRKKDQFLAILAHELRNPLAAIRYSLAYSRQAGVAEAERGRAHAIAERQLEHMAHLLDDLLDVSRIATGRVELKPRTIALGPLVQDALDATRALYTQRRHELRLEMPGTAVWLDADPSRITQVLANLLTNAAKYTDPGGRVELAVAQEDDEVSIRVSDNGIGFGPEMKERLFLLFNQDERARERSAGGLGIGLALVREFVERHGGRVVAESAGPGKGSRFTVWLPTVAAPQAVATAAAAG